MQALKALFWFFIVPAAVIAGIFFGLNKMGENKQEQKEEAKAAAAEAHLKTPTGYLSKKVANGLELRMNMMTKAVHLRGSVWNQGDRDIAKIQARINYTTKAKPGEKRPEYVDLGPIKSGESKSFDKKIYTAKSTPMYRISLVNLEFR